LKSCLQSACVALFIRHPLPGRVKTRLARDLGNEAACTLYQAMVADILVSVKTSGLPLYLFHDGLSVDGLPAEWLTGSDGIIKQSGNSLGERMTAAFEYLYSIGREQVILIGSDIPGIDAGLLLSANAGIAFNDVVFSPALDGGYCLIGSAKDHFDSRLFLNIPWSTDRVLSTSLDLCDAAGITYSLLEPRQDIDTLDDVENYCRQPSMHASSTNDWLISNGYMFSRF
jgi:rSAM/selenodomain-associated transferase 1